MSSETAAAGRRTLAGLKVTEARLSDWREPEKLSSYHLELAYDIREGRRVRHQIDRRFVPTAQWNG
jgi:hypothetical protein